MDLCSSGLKCRSYVLSNHRLLELEDLNMSFSHSRMTVLPKVDDSPFSVTCTVGGSLCPKGDVHELSLPNAFLWKHSHTSLSGW
jgi:hypothetical protein